MPKALALTFRKICFQEKNVPARGAEGPRPYFSVKLRFFQGENAPARGAEGPRPYFSGKVCFSGKNVPARGAEGTRPYFSGKVRVFMGKTPLRGMPKALALTFQGNAPPKSTNKSSQNEFAWWAK